MDFSFVCRTEWANADRSFSGMVACLDEVHSGPDLSWTQIPVCLWFLVRGRKRRGEILLINARKLGRIVDRRHSDPTGKDIGRIADTGNACRTRAEGNGSLDGPGFCKHDLLDEVRKHGHVLTPGHYFDVESQEDDGVPSDNKIKQLIVELCELRAEHIRFVIEIETSLTSLGSALSRRSLN